MDATAVLLPAWHPKESKGRRAAKLQRRIESAMTALTEIFGSRLRSEARMVSNEVCLHGEPVLQLALHQPMQRSPNRRCDAGRKL
jgi:hypothetical protein